MVELVISSLEREVLDLIYQDECPYGTRCPSSNYGSKEECRMDYTSCNIFCDYLIDYINSTLEDYAMECVREDKAYLETL